MPTSILSPLALRPFLALPLLPLPVLAAAPALQDAAGDADEAERMTQRELERIAREIEPEVAELRGHEFRRPVRVEVADEEELLGYIRKRMEMEYAPGEFEAEEDAAKLLGLIPADMDLMEALTDVVESQVGGYYDPEQDAFYLMARFADTGLTRTIIAHELTHALDDQLFGIDETLDEIGDDSDRKLAFHAVVEGSGTAVMNVWTMRKMAADELSVSDMMEAGDFGLEGLDELPEYVWKPLVAAYVRGQTFLSRTDDMLAASMKPADPDDIDEAFRSPPLSTEQVLHPAKYWDPERRDVPANVHLELDEIGDRWTVRKEDTLGELGLAMVATPEAERARIDPENVFSIMGVRYTNDAAEGWGGDRYVLFGRGDEQLLVGATMWDTAEDAAEFREAMAEVGIPTRAGANEPRAVFFHASRGLDEEEAARLAALVSFHVDE